ncbi:polymorphic toxin-type HINT domain-containing protein [Planobispora takensis]|uniref:polymorphic toxin-type HINT domain-containing protein n=1 Tax=Planobispora takensis TaxID=1367882 RepID=UPI001944D191|nr:polymorphic toxin-type HINT domain-containing protein [Planobispora takensis]
MNAALVVVLAPGLLTLHATPVTAVVRPITQVSAPPDTPDQLSGSAAGLPSLVSEKVTTSTVDVPDSKAKASSPKGAVPEEERSLAAAAYCSAYPAYNETQRYPAGSIVVSNGGSIAPKLWQAQVDVMPYIRPGQDSRWADRGWCDTGSPPDPGGQAPSVWQVHPTDQLLVDSRTPLLMAGGHSNDDFYPVEFTFKVCDNENMTGSGCLSSPAIEADGGPEDGQATWRIPAASKLAWSKQYWWTVEIEDLHSNQTATTDVGTFTTGVRQPVIASQLATRGVNGQDFHQFAGNYTTTVTDAVVVSAGPPLSIVRSYNSLDFRTDGLFGAGWSTRFDMKIQPETGSGVATALVTYPDGRRLRFAANGDGSYQPPPGMYATLAEVSGGGWKLMDKSSTVYLFDAQGRLTKITDADNRTLELEHGTDGKLSKVTAPGGRFLSFTWNGAHVASVSTPPVDGQTLTWTYTYQGDQLAKVCAPTATPACTSIDYAPGSLYRSSVLDSDPLGYWRLNEATGTDAADSGRGAGKATYGDATLKQPGALAGTSDTAAAFNGQASLELPRDSWNKLRSAVSFETWFKTSKPGIVLQLSSFADEFTFSDEGLVYIGTDGKLRGQLRKVQGSTPIAPITSTAAVNDGAWHHVVLTLTATEQRMYLDGQKVGVLTGTPTDKQVDYSIIAAGELYDSWPAVPASRALPYTGHIDEVALYDKPLTEQEIQAHHAAQAAGPGKLTKITLPSERIWVTNTYDAATDRLKTHTDQHGGTWKPGALTYDATTGLSTITVTDPKNNTLRYTHDAWRGYRLVSKTDQLDKTTTYRYDTGGFLSRITDPNNVTTKRVNDARGNTTAVTTCRAANNCQTRYQSYYRNSADEFDPRNDKVTASRDARSTSATDATYATTYDYTSHGQMTKVTTPATTDFPNGRTASSTYTDGSEAAIGGGTTPAGLLKSQKNARGDETSYRYTAAGDLAEQTTPTGLKITFAYDALGRMISRTEISEAHPDGVTSTFSYDRLGWLLTQTSPGVKNEITGVTHTAQTAYTYDADGNILTEALTDLTGGDPARTTTYTYDANGRTESVTDPEGGVARSTWDVTGAQISATDPLRTVRTFAYTKRGELFTTTLKNWTGSPVAPQPAKDVVLESNSYDPGGRLATRADAMGRKTTYTYFTDNLLSQVIADDVRLNGSTTPADVVLVDNTYDAAGQLTKQVAGGGKATTDYVYDAAGRVSSTMLDPATLKRKTAYSYDAAGNLTTKAFTGAGSSRVESIDYAYNTSGQVTRQTIENGDNDLVSSWTYDERGLLVKQTDPRGHTAGANAADFTTTLRYDALGQLVEQISPQVKIEKNDSATDGRPTLRYGYNTTGLQTHVVDAEGRTVTSTFDKSGRLTSVIAPAYTPPSGNALTPKISYAYDAADRITTITDPRGYATSIEYDALNNPVRVTEPGPSGPGGIGIVEYDLLGEQLAAVDPTGARVEATYDDLGRPITQTAIERKPTTAALTTRLTYDHADNLTKTVAPGSKTTNYTVNAAGQITEITDSNTNTSTFGYDALGRLAKVTDALGNATEASYDPAGRQTGAKDLDSSGATVRSFSFGYDAADNPTSRTSGEGHITRREYDALSRPVKLIEPVSADKSITTTFGYDATGARTRLTDGRGHATWTSYNSLGLVESLIEPATTAHPNAADRTWTQIYDAAGNNTATLQPGGVRIERTFDHLNRMVAERGSGAAVETPERTYAYDAASRPSAIGDYGLEYNDRGLLTKLTKSGNQVAAYSYDPLGNVTQRVDPTGTAAFTWDNTNRLKTASDPVTGRTWTYGYDKADRLTSLTSANPVNTQTFAYDAVDRLTSQTLKSSSGGELAKITYGWDKDDNLTAKITSGTAGAGNNTYSYDHAGRLTSWTGPDGKTVDYAWDDAGNRIKAGDQSFVYDERNRLLSGGGVDYTYSPRGTIATETKDGVTKNLVFDAFDRLITDGETRYGYDALGRVASRIKGTQQQRFVYSGLSNDISVITDSAGAIQAKYGRDAFGGLLSLTEGGSPALAVLNDLHGDVVGTFSGTTLVDSAAYDPFGQVTHTTGTKRSMGYQGEYTDPDTGKVNMHARWYQPGTGGFASRDDWTLNPSPSIQANRYTYANGSPLTNTDPTGHLVPGGGQCGTYVPCRAPSLPKPQSPSLGSKILSGVKFLAKRSPWGLVGSLNKPVNMEPYRRELDRIARERAANNNSRPGNSPRGSQGRAPDLRYENPRYRQPSETVPNGNGKGNGDGNGSSGGCSRNCNPCAVKGGCGNPRPPKGKENEVVITLTRTTVRIKPSGPTQEEKDKACQTGPCLGDYTGHPADDVVNTIGDGEGNGAGCGEGSYRPCGEESCNGSVGFSYSSSVGGCVPGGSGHSPGECNGVLGFVYSVSAGGCVPNPGNSPESGGESDPYPDAPPAPPVSCDPGNSFAAGTKVLMADGSTKPIEDVVVGDYVLAADPETGQTAAKRVTRLIVGNGAKGLVKVSVGGSDTDAVIATDNHPFWVPSLNSWLTAGELQSGMWLKTSAGTYVQITAVEKRTATQRVYNLSIADLHTYHVVAGDQAILVHNDGPGRDALGDSNFPDPEEVEKNRKAWGEYWQDWLARAAQKEVLRGRGPSEVHRIDAPEESIPGSKWHAQKKGRGSPALNQDGTFHDGDPKYSEKTHEWLRQYGWNC